MEISRHARNNMRLYNISERDILNASIKTLGVRLDNCV